MPRMLNPDSPCTTTITPDDKGGMLVELHIPTYSGRVTLTLQAERDNDGDWHVFIPWPDLDDEDAVLSVKGGIGDAAGGILYLGAPDVPVPDVPVEANT